MAPPAFQLFQGQERQQPLKPFFACTEQLTLCLDRHLQVSRFLMGAQRHLSPSPSLQTRQVVAIFFHTWQLQRDYLYFLAHKNIINIRAIITSTAKSHCSRVKLTGQKCICFLQGFQSSRYVRHCYYTAYQFYFCWRSLLEFLISCILNVNSKLRTTKQ